MAENQTTVPPRDRENLVRLMAEASFRALDADVSYVGSGENLHGVTIDGDANLVEMCARILAALEAAGCVVVPKEPTEGMARAGATQLLHRIFGLYIKLSADTYHAMLLASPYRPECHEGDARCLTM